MTLLVALVIGCGAKQKQLVSEAPVETKPVETPTVSFEPLSIPADSLIVPAAYPQSLPISLGEIVRGSGSIETSDSTRLAIADTTVGQTFRVQLMTSKVYSEARHAMRIAKEIFDRVVVLDYEVPYFKVRVGSFGDRDSAEDYLMQVKSAGYTSAWVVAVMVSVEQASPLYNPAVGAPLDSTTVDSLNQTDNDNNAE
jgi:hypothetical protein